MGRGAIYTSAVSQGEGQKKFTYNKEQAAWYKDYVKYLAMKSKALDKLDELFALVQQDEKKLYLLQKISNHKEIGEIIKQTISQLIKGDFSGIVTHLEKIANNETLVDQLQQHDIWSTLTAIGTMAFYITEDGEPQQGDF